MKLALIAAPVVASYSPTVPLPKFATKRVLPFTATPSGPGQIEVVGPDQMDQITGVELKSITFGEIESQTG